MKNIIKISIFVLVSIFLSACGGGGSSSGEFSSATNVITIVDCNTSTTTQALSGDTIVKDSTTTTVTIVDYADGTKTVCVDTGSAHLLR